MQMGVAVLDLGGRTIDAARLEEICTRYGIGELAVFGSVARGDATPASDVDLLYVLRPGARLGFAIDALEDELSDLFGRRVDLVARKAVHPLLRPAIEEQARTVYAA
jgi:predicted nucleotidyltransferase